MIYLVSSQQRIKTPSHVDEVIKQQEPDIYSQSIQSATIQDCLNYFKGKNIIEVDTETEHNKRVPKYIPNPYESKVLCVQLGDKQNQFVIDPTVKDFPLLSVLFTDKTKLKIFCNAFFDLRFFYHFGFITENIYDIFLAEMLLTLGKDMPKGYRGLEQMSTRYTGITISKSVRGQIHWRGLDDTVIKYAAGDVSLLNEIRIKQLEKINELNLSEALELENRFALVLAHIAYKGFKINPDKWMQVYESNLEKLKEYSLKLDNYLVDNNLHEFVDITLFDKRSLVNWNSSKQVIKLFKYLGIDTQARDKETRNIKDSVDEKHLSRQKNKFPILPIYLTYKGIQKELSTYGANFLRTNLNPVTGRIHSDYFQLADTGRITSSNPNLQNISATDENGEVHPLRECFIAEEGNSLIVSDYSQQEPRITAEYSQDPYLVDFILNGDGDMHSLVSTMISEYLLGTHVKVSKKNNPLVPRFNLKIRDVGKKLNLGLDYGKTAFSVKDDLDTSQEEAQRLLDIIAAKTPKKTEYFNKWINFVKKNGYIIIDFTTNRRCWFSKYNDYIKLERAIRHNRDKSVYSYYSKIKGELERFARNYRIQGTGGSMTKLAAVYFYEEIKQKGLWDKVWLVNLVHDELDIESINSYKETTAVLAEEAMIKAGTKFCKTIPMKAEPVITDCWNKS